jgi:hypothetical protein
MTTIANQEPTIYNDGMTVERLNALLDTITIKRFLSAALAAQTIRAALDLHGITLPILEVEGGQGGYYGPTSADSKFILHGVHSGTNPEMYAPPTEGEWTFKIVDADGPDGDFDDNLTLYIVMDQDEDNLIECYAQVVDDAELDDLINMDDKLTDFDYQTQVGGSIDDQDRPDSDRSGESKYQKQIRHVGNYREKD